MSGNIVQIINLVGHVIKEKKNRRTDERLTHFIRPSQGDDLKNIELKYITDAKCKGSSNTFPKSLVRKSRNRYLSDCAVKFHVIIWTMQIIGQLVLEETVVHYCLQLLRAEPGLAYRPRDPISQSASVPLWPRRVVNTGRLILVIKTYNASLSNKR